MELEELEQTGSRPQQPPSQRSKKQTYLVMLGCCLLQLPIWGIPMTYGIFQDYFKQHGTFQTTATGIVGTTMNGVMYLSMPILSTILDSGQWARWRRTVAIAGVGLSAASFLVASWSTQIWHLILLQGVCAALGGAMLYSPTTLFLDEWFKNGNRATAYGVQLSSKNVVGTGTPFLIYGLLNKIGFQWTMRIWAGITLLTGLFGLLIMPTSTTMAISRRPRKIPWTFLRHRTFYIYAIGNVVFSSGYGLPQTYLSQYATRVLHLPDILSALMITIFNAPGILSGVGFGILSDKFGISATKNTQISTLGSGLCVFLLWGLKSHRVPGLLISFAAGYGFFAGGYSSTWGGWIKQLEREASENNEAINTGMLYGLMNGARGIGFVTGGLAGVELLKAGAIESSPRWAYGTKYGALILFTGISAIFGGWGSVWKMKCNSNGRRRQWWML